MAAKYWIKLWHEVLQDPKMGRLPDNLWRRAIELMLLAGELGGDLEETDPKKGDLASTGEIAWHLRQPEERLEAEMCQLEQVGILTRLDNGGWRVVNFAKRQAHVSDAERMKQYRERKKKQGAALRDGKELVTRNVTSSVTFRNTDTDTDTDKEEQKEKEKLRPAPKPRHADFQQACNTYQYEIGGISGYIADALNDDLETYGLIWVEEAMKRAAKANIRRLDYVEGILKKWHEIGGPQNDKPQGEVKSRGRGKAPAEHSPLPPSPDLPPPVPPDPWAVIWEQAQAILQKQMTKQTFDTCFSGAEAGQNSNGTFTLNAKDEQTKELIINRLSGQVLKALQQIKPEIHQLQVTTK